MTSNLTTSTPRVLVVDDDEAHGATLKRLLSRADYDVAVADGATDALRLLREAPFDIVLTDLVMPGQSGLDLLHTIRHLSIDVDVVLMTAFGTVERAVEAMRAGAVDFIVKPIKKATLLRTLERVLERSALRRENRTLRAQLASRHGDGLVGVSAAFRQATALARQAASSNATVLLLGESGTGKELFARSIHQHSPRAERPFVALHCAALPETIIESELFGHEKGAFTGASRQRRGHIEAADSGTLFLDEIGELPLAVQVKLLRFLQEGEIQPVGSTETRRVDARVVAATHRDLASMVREGTFREDLYYRLNVISVSAPPLRERPEDIALLAEHFVALHCAGRARATGAARPAPVIREDAKRALEAYGWPGNVRELQNVMERALVLDTDGEIGADDLPGALVDAPPASAVTIRVGTSLAEAERQILLATLAHANGDKGLAASILGVGRRTVYRKLEEYAADRE